MFQRLLRGVTPATEIRKIAPWPGPMPSLTPHTPPIMKYWGIAFFHYNPLPAIQLTNIEGSCVHGWSQFFEDDVLSWEKSTVLDSETRSTDSMARQLSLTETVALARSLNCVYTREELIKPAKTNRIHNGVRRARVKFATELPPQMHSQGSRSSSSLPPPPSTSSTSSEAQPRLESWVGGLVHGERGAASL